jgi:hypothetical protein
LLSRVRETSPQTVRVVLTGHADIETAMAAVNEDAVFRFLTKPCDAGLLRRTLTACLLQHRLVRAEKELLENTLMGSIKVLTDVLCLASPAAFGRSLRINRYVQHIIRALRLESPWRYEAAAMLSQLGCITLEPELVETAYCGGQLNADEQISFSAHPSVAHDLLANIPRLEGIAWIIGEQFASATTDGDVSDTIKTGAAVLRIAIAFDDLKIKGRSDLQAVAELLARPQFDSRIVQTLETLAPVNSEMEGRTIETSSLEPGMVLNEDVRSNAGLLLGGKGLEVTYPLVVRLKNFLRRRAVKDKIAVLVSKNSVAETSLPAK